MKVANRLSVLGSRDTSGPIMKPESAGVEIGSDSAFSSEAADVAERDPESLTGLIEIEAVAVSKTG